MCRCVYLLFQMFAWEKMIAKLNECENDTIRVQGVVTMTTMSEHTVTKCIETFQLLFLKCVCSKLKLLDKYWFFFLSFCLWARSHATIYSCSHLKLLDFDDHSHFEKKIRVTNTTPHCVVDVIHKNVWDCLRFILVNRLSICVFHLFGMANRCIQFDQFDKYSEWLAFYGAKRTSAIQHKYWVWCFFSLSDWNSGDHDIYHIAGVFGHRIYSVARREKKYEIMK